MATEGSTALRGVTELSEALEKLYCKDSIPCRLYVYADGSGDRKNSNFKVQKGMMSLFIRHDMDEVVAARPAANHSYRNPVERCHCIANIGLQSVGMMRSKGGEEFERSMKKMNGNNDIRKECEKNAKFKEDFENSMKQPKELLEYVLGNKLFCFRLYLPSKGVVASENSSPLHATIPHECDE